MDKQELVDLLVECTMMIHTHRYFDTKTCDEVGAYIREQLLKCGVKSEAIGSSHVVIIDG